MNKMLPAGLLKAFDLAPSDLQERFGVDSWRS